MRIRAYLLLMAAAIGLPIILFSALALNMLLSSERRAALRSLDEMASATALLVDRELSSAEAALRVLAMSPHLADGDMMSFYRHARTADRGEGGRTILFAPDGQQLINTVLPLGSPLPPPPAYVTARTRQVIRTQQTLVSGLITGAVQQRPVTTINIPVRLDGGQRYVLASVFGTDYFQNLLAKRELPPAWTVSVIDGSGRYIARRGPASSSGIGAIGTAADPGLLAEAGRLTTGSLRHATPEGSEVYEAFTRSVLPGWTVAVSAPVGEIEASARKAVITVSFGLLLTLVSTVLAASFFGRRLMGAIERASRAASALARSRIPEPEPVGVREVDELYGALKNAGMVLAASEAQRSALLHSEQQARTLAEQQNKSKDEFLAMLGHELRNPLSGIMGALQLMELPGVGEERKQRAREIVRRQAAHLTDIVDDLLDVARLAQGKIRLELQPVDLGAAVQATTDALLAAGRTGHAMTVEAGPVWVMADLTRLDQIINNLMTNALKYTPAGGSIHVRVAAEGEDAVLSVQDTGIGISADLLPRLFDIFIQGSVSLDRSEGGLGIGLSLVRHLVQLHGGEITADSPGHDKGSTFTVRMPRIEAPAAPGEQEPRHAHARLDAQVLLIEDNDDARHVLAERLAASGLRVLEAADGRSGIEIACAHLPDVAIVDVGLPQVDGYALARRLRATEATAAMSLIALTGYGQEADRRTALEAGFDAHFVKPAQFDPLMECIQRLQAGRLERSGAVQRR